MAVAVAKIVACDVESSPSDEGSDTGSNLNTCADWLAELDRCRDRNYASGAEPIDCDSIVGWSSRGMMSTIDLPRLSHMLDVAMFDPETTREELRDLWDVYRLARQDCLSVSGG